jgi:hypothetical protein
MEQAQFVGYFAVVDVAQVLCDRAHYGTNCHRLLRLVCVSCGETALWLLTSLVLAAKLMPELERLQERQQDEGSNRSPEGQALPPRRDDWYGLTEPRATFSFVELVLSRSIPSGFFGTTIGAFLSLIKQGKVRCVQLWGRSLL